MQTTSILDQQITISINGSGSVQEVISGLHELISAMNAWTNYSEPVELGNNYVNAQIDPGNNNEPHVELVYEMPLNVTTNNWAIIVDNISAPRRRLREGSITELEEAGFIHHFRMVDADEQVYYEGLSCEKDSLIPLDDYGTPEAGCTTIEYWNPNIEQWYRIN